MDVCENRFEGAVAEWYAGCMSGIISKDMGPDYFCFAAAGRTCFNPPPGDNQYSLKIGKITMTIDGPETTDEK